MSSSKLGSPQLTHLYSNRGMAQGYVLASCPVMVYRFDTFYNLHRVIYKLP
jgi:hypothetical protein